ARRYAFSALALVGERVWEVHRQFRGSAAHIPNRPRLPSQAIGCKNRKAPYSSQLTPGPLSSAEAGAEGRRTVGQLQGVGEESSYAPARVVACGCDPGRVTDNSRRRARSADLAAAGHGPLPRRPAV